MFSEEKAEENEMTIEKSSKREKGLFPFHQSFYYFQKFFKRDEPFTPIQHACHKNNKVFCLKHFTFFVLSLDVRNVSFFGGTKFFDVKKTRPF
jgi:hypothetical protein